MNLPDTRTVARILVADDDTTQRMLLRAALEQGGFAVVEAENGITAIEQFIDTKPDLVLLDVTMPDLDGYNVCRQIRERFDGRNLPIVMVTGLEDIESIDRAYDVGATDFMTKPVTLPTLCYRVRYLLRAARAFSDLSSSKASLTFAQHVAELGSWVLETTTGEFIVSDELLLLLGITEHNRIKSLEDMLDFVHQDDLLDVKSAMSVSLEHNRDFKLEHKLNCQDGSTMIVAHQAEAVLNSEGETIQIHGIIQNITRRKQAEDKIRELAYYDPLTGLPNRQLFRNNIQHLIYTAKREQTRFALLFVDLDNFKDVNDTLGHSAGDSLLRTIAQFIQDSIRLSDFLGVTDQHKRNTNTSISRLGGDEFTVLIPNLESIDDACVIAKRVLSNLQQPIEIQGNLISVTGSIGIAVYPDDGDEPDNLLKNADIAMYHAKQSGKNKHRFFDWQMNGRIMARVKMESNLRHALENNECSLHYQPKIELSSGKLIGFEGLIRWTKSNGDMISPMDFIPIAEESGLIIEIGEWVIREACFQIRRWQDEGLDPFIVSVNLSPMQFQTHNLIDVVSSALENSGILPEYLELELTESAVMENVDKAIDTMDALKRFGIRLSIDDFGTGYSSMEYLKRFPVDVLKIDKSFVQDITTDQSDAAIIKAIIALTKALDLISIAEGVETREQIDFLHQHNCDQVQGYYYSKPLPVKEIPPFIANQRSNNKAEIAQGLKVYASSLN